MKLTLKEIHFIDTYLKNSEIEFVDVRMEMLDHVASEVEHKMETEKLDFYNAFKKYMVHHKKSLIEQHKKFIKTPDKKVYKELGLLLIRPFSLLTFGLCFLALKITSHYADLSMFLRFIPIAILVMLVSYYYFIVFRLGKKQRYSGVERIGFVLIFVTQLLQLFFISNPEKPFFESYEILKLAFNSFLVVLAIGFIRLLRKMSKKYTHRYKNNIV